MSEQLARILIVDDVEINREIYARALSALPNVEIHSTGNGHEAIAIAQKHEFAVYLIDIVMPGMDGFELASLLRQESSTEAVPILFVTSHEPDPDFVMRGYRMGAVDYLVRVPVDIEILVQKVRVFLRLFRKRKELAETLEEAQREIQGLHSRLEEYIRQHEQLRMQATHDGLTGLPNRALFQDRLDHAIKRSQRNRQRFAIAYVDLDGFKAINDNHGHAGGDELIIAAGNRLAQAVRGVDTVARIGGDEFAVLLEGLDSIAGAEYVADKMHRMLTQPLTLENSEFSGSREVKPGASIGLAIYPDHSDTRETLVSMADMSMYEAKRAGGGARLHGARPPSTTPQLVRDRTLPESGKT